MASNNTTKITPARRFGVRLALITGSTLATILGAQSLAVLDSQNIAYAQAAVPLASDSGTVLVPQAPSPAAGPIVQVAPNIVILRRPGQQGTTQSGAANTGGTVTTGQPASPQIILPNPVIVQQSGGAQVPNTAFGRSSR